MEKGPTMTLQLGYTISLPNFYPDHNVMIFKGVTLDLANDNKLVDTWGEELVNPHDVAVAHAGDAVYVVEIGPGAVRKFEVVTPAAEMF